MKENKASMTSLLSAFGRAYHSKYDTPVIFDDFLAQDLISEKSIRTSAIISFKVYHFQ